jgi:hypothetical protein
MMGEKEDIEKIIVEVARKDETETKTYFVNHDEDHSYQGVLVDSKTVRFFIRHRIEHRRCLNRPLASNANFLDLILNFDVSRWTDVPDPELKEKYKDVRKKFIEECDKIHPDDFIEIAYSRDLRCKHIDSMREEVGDSFGSVPLVYYPLGFESYTSSYTRQDMISPEVIDVKVINEVLEKSVKNNP